MTVDGQLAEVAGGWELRFHRVLPHPPEKVWQVITDPEHLSAWFPQRVEGRIEPGATLRFVSDVAPAWEGRVLVCERPRRLELTWGTDVLRFELQPDSDGGTVLSFTDRITELGKAARDTAGWHTCLDVLEAHLAGRSPDFTHSERWKQVHPGYVERFGAAAAAIGPPPGALDEG